MCTWEENFTQLCLNKIFWGPNLNEIADYFYIKHKPLKHPSEFWNQTS